MKKPKHGTSGNESERAIDALYWDNWYADADGLGWRARAVARERYEPSYYVSPTEPFYKSRTLRQQAQDEADERENDRIWRDFWANWAEQDTQHNE